MQTISLPSNLTGWVASEKLDGIRAIWTGEFFMTRQGKILKAPAWFTAGMPDVRLDGEIYMGRNSFNQLVSTIQKKGSNWDGVQYHVFDYADNSATITDGIAKLQTLSLPSHVKLVEHRTVANHAELDAWEKQVVDGGGEGLVIRNASAKYRGTFGDGMLKVKRLFPDLERWQG
jgi:DNA ligase-1